MAALKIVNHRLVGVPFIPANSYGGEMKPSLIVEHDTAGRLDKGSSVAWFRSKECKTSAHVVIERDGSIVQMVPFNRKAFHAGKSFWRGKHFLNSDAIGIEIVNPGILDKNGRAWFHKPNEKGFVDIVHKCTPEHGDGWWLPYTDAQIKANKELCRALMEEYSDCNEIVTHWMISPRRKIDTNPLFPLEEVRAYALGIDDGEDEVPSKPPADVIGKTMPPPPATPVHSTEVQGAVMAQGTGGMGMFYQGQKALEKATSSGELDWQVLVLSLLLDPIFMGFLVTTLFAAYAMFKRITRIKIQGV